MPSALPGVEGGVGPWDLIDVAPGEAHCIFPMASALSVRDDANIDDLTLKEGPFPESLGNRYNRQSPSLSHSSDTCKEGGKKEKKIRKMHFAEGRL